MATIEQISLGLTAGELIEKINEIIAALNEIQPATSYEDLEDKPSINGVTLSGNKVTSQLQLALSGATDYYTLLNTLATKTYADAATASAVQAAQDAAAAALSGKLDADLSALDEVRYIAEGGHALVLAGGALKLIPLRDLAAYTEVRMAASRAEASSGIASQRRHIPLSGEQDGKNAIFTAQTGFVLGTTALYLNGQMLTEGKDYSESSSYQITMLTHLPVAEDTLILMAIPASV